MGPISTGLGEVYWWSVEYAPPGEGVPSATASRVGKVTVRISPPKASASPMSFSAPSICGPCRTGSSGRR